MDVMEKGNNYLKKESTSYGTCHQFLSFVPIEWQVKIEEGWPTNCVIKGGGCNNSGLDYCYAKVWTL